MAITQDELSAGSAALKRVAGDNSTMCLLEGILQGRVFVTVTGAGRAVDLGVPDDCKPQLRAMLDCLYAGRRTADCQALQAAGIDPQTVPMTTLA